MIPELYTELFNNELFKEIMDKIEDVVMIIDENTTVVYVNKSYEKTFNRKSKVIIGKKLADIEGDTVAVRVLASNKPIVHKVEYLKSVNMEAMGISFPLNYDGRTVGAVSVFNNAVKYVELAAGWQREKEMNNFLQEQLDDSSIKLGDKDFITVNPFMKRIIAMALKVAKSATTVLIRGESGVGKDVLAHLIHKNSEYSGGTFVKVNCAAIPDTLLESELFGYEKGAFTGARKEGKPGKFELAQNGTIFLTRLEIWICICR